jgi:hypothetical protein
MSAEYNFNGVAVCANNTLDVDHAVNEAAKAHFGPNVFYDITQINVRPITLGQTICEVDFTARRKAKSG